MEAASSAPWNRRWLGLAVGLLLVLLGGLAAVSARRTGCTIDEPQYVDAGRIALRHGWVHERGYLQGPLALYANQIFLGEYPSGGFDRMGEDADELLFRARLGTLAFVLPGALLVFAWSRRLFGDAGGLLSLACLALHPLWLGYSGTALVDAQHACVLLAALYALARHLERPGAGRLAWFALLSAAAVATKYLALVALVPAGVLAVGASAHAAGGRRAFAAGVGAAGLTLATGLVTLHACYGFRAGFEGVGELSYSALFARLRALPGAREALAVLPAPFVRGIDYQLSQGEGGWVVFLEGEFLSGAPLYYAWVFLRRTPELLLVLALPAAWLARRARRSDLVALLVPLGVFFLYLSLGTEMQLGVRYALVFVPALCLLLGALATWTPLARAPRRAALVGGVLASYLGVELVRAGPDWLAYFNASGGGQALAYHHLRDSNGDYGQQDLDQASLAAQLGGRTCVPLHPWAGARFGLVAVRLPWLRRRDPGAAHARLDWAIAEEPLAHLGATWFVFEVTPARLAARLAGEERADLRRALGLAHLGAGEREEARRVLAPLALAVEDPLARLLAEPELSPEESSDLWAALAREDLAGRLPKWRELRRTGLDEEEDRTEVPGRARVILPGMKPQPGPRERQRMREEARRLLE